MSTNLVDSMSEVDAKDLLNEVFNRLGIGGKARTKTVLLECLGNAIRRSDCLSRIETHMVTLEPDEECEVSLLNWGEEPDKYLETFKGAIKHCHPLQE